MFFAKSVSAFLSNLSEENLMGCRYCENILSKDAGQERPSYDRILFESEHFVALPTLGALVEGWLLVVSKKHYICMGAIQGKLFKELEHFKNRVGQAVKDCYGSIAVFEHGPSRSKQPVGCGVDHAHIHIVPTNCDLVDGLHNVLAEKIRWTEISGIDDAGRIYMSGRNSFYVEQPMGLALVVVSGGFGSQLFRQVVARHIGMPDRFDWKLHSGEENARRTVDRLTLWRGHDDSYARSNCLGIEEIVI